MSPDFHRIKHKLHPLFTSQTLRHDNLPFTLSTSRIGLLFLPSFAKPVLTCRPHCFLRSLFLRPVPQLAPSHRSNPTHVTFPDHYILNTTNLYLCFLSPYLYPVGSLSLIVCSFPPRKENVSSLRKKILLFLFSAKAPGPRTKHIVDTEWLFVNWMPVLLQIKSGPNFSMFLVHSKSIRCPEDKLLICRRDISLYI